MLGWVIPDWNAHSQVSSRQASRQRSQRRISSSSPSSTPTPCCSSSISLHCPIYITANLLPQFQHATRLAVYQTTSLPNWLPKHGVNIRFEQNAMEHLHWIARKIDANRNLIEPTKLFYEGGTHKRLSSVEVARVTRRDRLRSKRQAPVTLGIPCVAQRGNVHTVRLANLVDA